MEATRSFAPEPDQVAAARRFVTRSLTDWGFTNPDVSLLVSELATNAVLHARSDFQVCVTAVLERIRVEVSDHNSRVPTMVPVPADAHSGRGLMLIQALAGAWGVEAHPGAGKTIWFEVGARRG
ncbi:MAG: ATP-binding protein [Actinomycetota bacterium]|nr:ATP-binding protein [Actinomycetota bacterium]